MKRRIHNKFRVTITISAILQFDWLAEDNRSGNLPNDDVLDQLSNGASVADGFRL